MDQPQNARLQLHHLQHGIGVAGFQALLIDRFQLVQKRLRRLGALIIISLMTMVSEPMVLVSILTPILPS